LLHVIDCGDPGFERQLEVTEDVLHDIRADNVARIKIFNKIDHLGDEAAQAEHEAALLAKYPDSVVMSAVRPMDVARLHAIIVAHFQRDLVEGELFVPWNEQHLRGEIFSGCQVVSERADAKGALFVVRAEAATLEQLRERLNPSKQPVREEWERDS
jgi:GTP-binding protein HflX